MPALPVPRVAESGLLVVLIWVEADSKPRV
jgi:hypothetical protein